MRWALVSSLRLVRTGVGERRSFPPVDRKEGLDAGVEGDERGGLGAEGSAMISTGPKASSFLR